MDDTTDYSMGNDSTGDYTDDTSDVSTSAATPAATTAATPASNSTSWFGNLTSGVTSFVNEVTPIAKAGLTAYNSVKGNPAATGKSTATKPATATATATPAGTIFGINKNYVFLGGAALLTGLLVFLIARRRGK
jgi:hypothetical protein